MLIAIGTKVMLIHSKDEAVVTGLLDDNMIRVRLLDSDLEIPVFSEDVRRLDDTVAKGVKAKIVPGKKEKKMLAPPRAMAESQYTILKSFGIQLAFAPVLKLDVTVEKYEIFLINDTAYPVLFNFTLVLNGRKALQYNGKLDAVSIYPLGELLFDQLNDAPHCQIECWRIMTDGTGPRMEKKLRIKPQQFFQKVITAPLLDRPAHLYRLFEKLADRSEKQQNGEDLKTYAKRQSRPRAGSQENIGERMPHEVLEFAEFIPEIDLHIDRLVPNAGKIDKTSILRIQLEHFEHYMEKAIRLGVERVFIIHGVGAGRLKDRIASRLIQIPEVRTFKNEYHPRYGYGATEVIF